MHLHLLHPLATPMLMYVLDTGHRLMLAAFGGHLGCVKELCYHGADKEVTDNSGSTVLHWAMDSGNCQLVAWLLDNGADIHATDVNGWTPLLRTCTLQCFASLSCCSTKLQYRALFGVQSEHKK